jgi:hypothetical protein
MEYLHPRATLSFTSDEMSSPLKVIRNNNYIGYHIGYPDIGHQQQSTNK